jgi:flagella basal body P-ring formation protein FlgA
MAATRNHLPAWIGLLAALILAMPAAKAASCLRVLKPVPQGSIIQSQNFIAAPCGTPLERSFAYERANGAVQATRDLSGGEIVPAYAGYAPKSVAPGETLTLVVRLGAVRVARQVEALQAAGPGERLFVRSEDGQVLSVRYVPGVP